MVSCSSAEAKYRALANTTCKITWVWNLLEELCVPIQIVPTIASYSSASVSILKNPILHVWMKHVKIDQHVVRDLLVKKVVNTDNLTDIMTKSLFKQLFLDLRDHLLLTDIHDPSA